MKIYNSTKTVLLEDPDLTQGKLVPEKLLVAHHDAVPYTPARGHFEEYIYSNGGISKKWVLDEAEVPAKEAWDEYEDILIYVSYTEEEYLDYLRSERKRICYPIINRGKFWYDSLSTAEKQELKAWYNEWLDVTETLEVPEMPEWLSMEEE